MLEHVTDREIDEAEKLLKAGFCDCVLKDDVANLYIEAYAVCKKTEKSEALVVIEDEHTNITHIEKDGQVLFHKEKKEYCQEREKTPDKSLLNLEDIITFANEVQITDVEKVLGRQIKYNTRIAEEGFEKSLGSTGRTSCARRVRRRCKVARCGESICRFGCKNERLCPSGDH